MRIDLPFPHKALWPNGRAHHMAKAREAKKHRQWAHTATLEALQEHGTGGFGPGKIPITIEVHAKAKGPLPDADNCSAACKAMLDGIADALGVNDRDFAAPLVVFSPERDGRFVVIIGRENYLHARPWTSESGLVTGMSPEEQEAA
jgi:hypothetical protein